jgi:hypothetical protein
MDCSAVTKPCMLDRGRVDTSAQPPKGARALTTELAVRGRDDENDAEKPDRGLEGDGDGACLNADEPRNADDAAEGGREAEGDVERWGEDEREFWLAVNEGVGPPVWKTLLPLSSAGGGEGGSYGMTTGEPVLWMSSSDLIFSISDVSAALAL